MTYGNAVHQREEMIAEYERILKTETDPSRRSDIEDRIFQCQDEIAELKKGKPLFGRPKPLRQTTTIIEPDRESPGGQKVTVINPKPVQDPSDDTTPAPTQPRLHNNLRTEVKAVVNKKAENALRAQIQAVKAAKKTT